MTHAQLAHAILRALLVEKRAANVVNFGGRDPPLRFHPQDVQIDGYPQEQAGAVDLAVAEAWAWMDRELILVVSDFLTPGWRKLSRVGEQFLAAADPAPLLAARQIDRTNLHPALQGEALDNFLRGAYDVSVFCAFRDVEVAVRKASGLPETRLGIQLMADAFNPTGGPLRDTGIAAGEQTAMMNLFQGAIGLFKNPGSHRYVQVDAKAAAELLILASHLLALVDARTPRA
ncbi:TIGR02391 family protein [Dokdonella fugitiva]|nr:TIGR02391 family protein [Dokdonella fugitiva]